MKTWPLFPGFYNLVNPNSPLVYDLDRSDLISLLASWGEPAYRAGQVWNGLYRSFYDSPGEFTALPKTLRQRMASELRFEAFAPKLFLDSSDGQTRKTLFSLPDGNLIEAVLMRYDKRRTLCISTQAGCAMGCVFCATGQMGFKRHLSSGEIVSQVLYYARMLAMESQSVSNVVLMGMGEPFHNYENTMAAIDRLNDPQGYNFGARRFTISTVGLVPAIRRFADRPRRGARSRRRASASDATAALPEGGFDLVHAALLAEYVDPEALAADAPERSVHLELYNRKEMVMGRLNNPEKYQREVERIVGTLQANWLETYGERLKNKSRLRSWKKTSS